MTVAEPKVWHGMTEIDVISARWDPLAKERVIFACQCLIWSKWRNWRSVEQDDAYSLGNLALLQAIENFNIEAPGYEVHDNVIRRFCAFAKGYIETQFKHDVLSKKPLTLGHEEQFGGEVPKAEGHEYHCLNCGISKDQTPKRGKSRGLIRGLCWSCYIQARNNVAAGISPVCETCGKINNRRRGEAFCKTCTPPKQCRKCGRSEEECKKYFNLGLCPTCYRLQSRNGPCPRCNLPLHSANKQPWCPGCGYRETDKVYCE